MDPTGTEGEEELKRAANEAAQLLKANLGGRYSGEEEKVIRDLSGKLARKLAGALEPEQAQLVERLGVGLSALDATNENLARVQEALKGDLCPSELEALNKELENLLGRRNRLLAVLQERSSRLATALGLLKKARKIPNSWVKEFAKKVGKKVPGVGVVLIVVFFAEDVEAKGVVGATMNAVLDAATPVAVVKGVHEVATGRDWIPDESPYSGPSSGPEPKPEPRAKDLGSGASFR